MAKIDFNSDGIDVSDNHTPLPAGDYLVTIIKSEMKKTKRKDGAYLALTFEVLEPDEANGRKVFDNINIENSNKLTVEIARKTLAKIVTACGKTSILDSDELHNIPIMATLAIEDGTGQYSAKNKIVHFQPAGSNAPQDRKPGRNATQTAKSPSNGNPWD